MQFDFTNTSDQGYTTLPPDRYAVETTEWWLRKKEDTGNIIIDIDTKVISGKYEGETPRYFHVILDNEKSKGYLLRMLRNLGIIVDGDRGKNGELVAEFIYGEKGEDGRVRITAVEINGDAREVSGRPATAVVVKRSDDPTQTKIQQLDPCVEEATEGAAAAPSTGVKAPASRARKGTIPF